MSVLEYGLVIGLALVALPVLAYLYLADATGFSQAWWYFTGHYQRFKVTPSTGIAFECEHVLAWKLTEKQHQQYERSLSSPISAPFSPGRPLKLRHGQEVNGILLIENLLDNGECVKHGQLVTRGILQRV